MTSKHLNPLKSAAAPRDFGNFGLETIAYIKPLIIDGQKVHAIHAADGTPLTIVSARATAFAAVHQYDLEPQSVH